MFRFTIRDVLWLTVVVAVGVGWLVNYAQWQPMYVESVRFGAQGYREADRLEVEVKQLRERIAELESAASDPPPGGKNSN